MAPKRGSDGRFKSSGGSLTGGTGDVKPQIMTITVPAGPATDNYSVQEFAIPRIVMQSDRAATVMEILKVWYYPGFDVTDSTITHVAFLSFRQLRAIGEGANPGTILNDWEASSSFAVTVQSLVTTGAGGSTTYNLPMENDLTDSNGNGIMVATDRLFAQIATINNSIAFGAAVKILYRMVNIGILEYIGIVQSQQSF